MTSTAVKDGEGRQMLQDLGLLSAAVFAVGLTILVEYIGRAFVGGPVHAIDWFVLALIAAPLLISIGAIGICLARRPLWMRWAFLVSILLIPQAFLFGVFNG